MGIGWGPGTHLGGMIHGDRLGPWGPFGGRRPTKWGFGGGAPDAGVWGRQPPGALLALLEENQMLEERHETVQVLCFVCVAPAQQRPWADMGFEASIRG